MRMPAIAAVLLIFAAEAAAKPAECDSLSGEKAQTASRLLDGIHPYDCCDRTIAACLEDEDVTCSLVGRLAADVCRQVADGRSEDDIKRAMSRRAQSMMPALSPAEIEIDEATRAGDASAPVTLVMYACTTCPFCYAIASDLHDLVTDGSLEGKVKLYYRSYPLRDHENSVEGGLAVTAAARMGRFWPLTRLVYERMGEFSVDAVADWAESVGLERDEFERVMSDPATREALVQSRREGMRNRVRGTPTFFINGRRYVYETTLPVLENVLLEEHERVAASSPKESGGADG